MSDDRERFGKQVDEAAAAWATHKKPEAWLLLVFNVPDRLTGLTARLSFKASKENPTTWWRRFDPARDKSDAKHVRAALIDAGLKGRWTKVDGRPKPKPVAKPYTPRHPSPRSINFAAHNVTHGGWQLKRRRRP